MKKLSFSRSLFAVEDIKEGDVFTEQNFKINKGKRVEPKYLKNIIGKNHVRVENMNSVFMEIYSERKLSKMIKFRKVFVNVLEYLLIYINE